MAAYDNLSGSITSGGTAQTISTQGRRRAFMFQNVSDTAMYLEIGADATTDSMLIAASGGFVGWSGDETPVGKISVYGAVTGKKYWCKETLR